MNESTLYNIKTLYPNRRKCMCCGGEIISDNVVCYSTGVITGRSFASTKVVNGHTYYLLVCDKCIQERYPGPINLGSICEKTKWAFNISDEDYYAARKGYAMNKEKMIKKYGEEEGLKKWEAYRERQAETNTFEYKQKTYGWTREQFDSYNESRSVTKKNLIQRHGKEEGLKMWEAYRERQKLTKSKQYVVETYGVDRWDKICDAKRHNLKNFIARHGEKEGRKRWKEFVEASRYHYSKISQLCFNELDKYLGNKYTTYYATKNYEYVVCGDKAYHIDYFIKELNIAIEFNGDSWHGNPNIYAPSDKCHPVDSNITAQELQEKDSIRSEYLLKECNVKTYIIWESEYKQDWDAKDFITNILKIEL